MNTIKDIHPPYKLSETRPFVISQSDAVVLDSPTNNQPTTAAEKATQYPQIGITKDANTNKTPHKSEEFFILSS